MFRYQLGWTVEGRAASPYSTIASHALSPAAPITSFIQAKRRCIRQRTSKAALNGGTLCRQTPGVG
ncbi:hypothetical protein ACFL59_11615, partial [Planctomycetota bacterium]